MKMNKKLATLLVLTTLILGIIPIIPVNAAVAITDIEDKAGDPITSGDYGDTIVVKGDGVTSGSTINVYWDYALESGLMNSTKADPDGTFEVWLTIPEATAGDHYIWVKDVETGLTAMSTAFTVLPLVEVDPESGLPGDTITVKGYGFADKEEITCSDDFEDALANPLDATFSPSTIESDDVGSWTVMRPLRLERQLPLTRTAAQ